MSSLSWNPSYPASASTASEGDNALRSLMTNFATGVGEMIYFPGSAVSQGSSADSTGDVLLGTARAARVSNVSGNVGNGYLGLETSKGGLWHLGSSWTYAPLGHPAMQVAKTGVTAPFTARWVRLYGQTRVPASGTTTSATVRTAFNVTFGAAPVVVFSHVPGLATQSLVGVVSDTTGITSVFSVCEVGGWTTTIWWESVGTVAY